MLTVATIKAARPRACAYRLSDAGGLFLHVLPSGHRAWRMRAWLGGKEVLLTFGAWPDVDLGRARELRDLAREQLDCGQDPRVAAAPTENGDATRTFEAIARRWHAHSAPRWSSVHAADVLVSLERDVFPTLGAMPIGAITTPVVLSALRAIEARGSVETARRVQQRISGVFEFSMSEGVATSDPAAIVGRALAPAPIARRQPALVELDDARALLAAAELVDAAPIIKLASRFLALTATRLAAVRGARWDEFEGVDWDGETTGREVWRVPAARMKLFVARKADPAAAHLVPLSAQAVEVVRAARRLSGGRGLVFRGRGGIGPLGEAAIGALYARTPFAGRHVPHGWRASFSTILNERRRGDRELIDQALAHAAKDKNEVAYNRSELLDLRRELFQRWADLVTGV